MRTPSVLLAFSLALPCAAAEPDGARIYAERCAGCHGEQGGGDGPAAAALVPRPKSLRDGGRSLEQIEAAVRKGKPGTMMMAFAGMLTDAEIAVVVRHVQRLATPGK